MKATRVVHCKREPYDVYIGRPSKFGNPYRIGVDGTRDEVIEKFRHWIATHPTRDRFIAQIKEELQGRVLGCWCSPLKCHGDILAELADGG